MDTESIRCLHGDENGSNEFTWMRDQLCTSDILFCFFLVRGVCWPSSSLIGENLCNTGEWKREGDLLNDGF